MTTACNFLAKAITRSFVMGESNRETTDLDKVITDYVEDKTIPNWQRKPRKIAEEKIHEWQKKKTSDFSLSKLDLRVIPNVFAFVCFNNNLKVLDLSETNITELPDSIGDLTFLEELNLRKNKLKSLNSNVGKLKNLQKLILNDNKLSALPEDVCNLSNLEVLSARLNTLRNIPSMLTKLIKLTTLDVSYNSLEELPMAMEIFTQLAVLGLEYNKLTVLPVGVTTLFNLVSFTHNGNKFPKVCAEITEASDIADGNAYSVMNIEDPITVANPPKRVITPRLVLNLHYLYCENILRKALGNTNLQENVEELKLNVGFVQVSEDREDVYFPSEILKFKNLKKLTISERPGMEPLRAVLALKKTLTKVSKNPYFM